jgi:hypothetical protein
MKLIKNKRLVSLPGFNKIELEGEIEEHESTECADSKLRLELSKLVEDEELRCSLMTDSASLQWQKTALEEDIKVMRNWIRENEQKLRDAGFDLTLPSDEIPF